MDKRVFITLFALIVLIGAVIGIKMMLKNDCELPEITYEPLAPEIGEVVKFTCTNADENINWDFGDGKTSSGKEATHKFDTARAYNVKATVNEACENSKEVTVLAPRKMETVEPSINIPSPIYAEESVTFNEETPGATRWSWRVNETGDSASGQSFNYTFDKPGSYSITLTLAGAFVNGDTTFTIEVQKPKPVEKPKAVVVEKKPTVDLEAIRLRKVEEKRKADEARKAADAGKAEEKRKRAEAAKAEGALRAEEKRKKAAELESTKPHYSTDVEFKTKFMQIANDLKTDDNDASEQWRDVILKQVCANQSLRVEMTNENNEKMIEKSEEFKRSMITGKYVIVQVTDVGRGADKCISKINAKVKTVIGKN